MHGPIYIRQKILSILGLKFPQVTSPDFLYKRQYCPYIHTRISGGRDGRGKVGRLGCRVTCYIILGFREDERTGTEIDVAHNHIKRHSC